MRDLAAAALVVGGMALLAYVLAGYALLVRWLAAWRGRPVERREPTAWPRLAVLISAYNEARDLPAKLRSVLACDYPPERLQILVADDGSRDETSAVVAAVAAEPAAAGRLRLLERTANLGKPSQLNRLAAAAEADLLVFTDARQPLDPAALRHLVAWFADESVGGVSGAVQYRTAGGEPVPIGAYWRYESALRESEGRLHSCCGAAGPLLAMRRELFQPYPADLVLDDVLGPLRIVLGGRRFVYAADAVAYETYAMHRRHEYDRRVRTLAGNYQVLRYEPRLLLPWRNPIAWQYLSHKVGRLLVPWGLLAVLAGTLLGLPQPWAVGLLLAQGLCYLYAWIGWLGAGQPWAPKGSSLACNLVMLAVAAIAGLLRDLRGGSQARWAATEQHRRG
ncbi:MAG: glycosyltransferase family 2 protein [Fimbriimonadaceae bacterium]|nr:glycosyltransferase family 2 protein [Fimbriimonadaceae bacterium]